MPEVSGSGGCISAMRPTILTRPTSNNSNFLDKTLRTRQFQFGYPIAETIFGIRPD